MEPNVLYSTLEIKDICRVCLKMSPNKCSIWDAIFVYDVGNIQYVEMIMECTSVIVEKDSGFPEYICSDCSQQLITSYCFKLRCEKSNANLEQIFEILKASGKSCDYILIANPSILSDEKVKNEILVKNQENDLEINEKIIQSGNELIKEEKVEKLNEKEEYYLDTSEINDAEDVKDVTLKSIVDVTPDLNEDIPRNVTKSKSRLKICASPLPCPYCFRKFKNKKNLTLHENYCQKETFNCGQCSEKFPNHSLLSKHLSTSHGEVPAPLFTCDICNDIFEDKSSLIEHFYIHIETSLYLNYDFDGKYETYLCYPCDKNFSSTEKLIKHCNKHSQDKDYRCRECGEDFKKYKLLEKHMRAHDIQPYFCDKCLLSFDNINKVKVHEEVKHLDPMVKDTFKCSLCENIFKNLFQLNNHLKEHKADLYKCLVCFKSCNSIVEYKNHKKEHNVCNLCPSCGKQFPRALSLYAHVELCHTKTNRVTCDVCNKTYSTAQSLKIHKRTHTKEKPYICSYCPYRVGYLGDLQKHVRIHTGDAPYACKFPNCGQRFKNASHRNVHHRQHTGERNYECQICKMKFGRSDILREHLRIHSSKKEFKCGICGKEFRRRHHVTIHKSKVHGSPKDKCNKI